MAVDVAGVVAGADADVAGVALNLEPGFDITQPWVPSPEGGPPPPSSSVRIHHGDTEARRKAEK